MIKNGIEFYDDTTNMIQKLSTVSLSCARQGLQQASSKVAKAYRQEIENEPDTMWGSTMLGGKKFVSFGGKKKKFGELRDKNNTTKKAINSVDGGNLNIKHFVKFYLPPKQPTALYAVVAGGHPSFRPARFKDGMEVGSMPLQKGTTQETLSILQKLEDGYSERLPLSVRKDMLVEQDKYLYKRGQKMFLKDIPDTIEHKARNFSRTALSKSKGEALNTVSKLFDEVFPAAVANTQREVKVIRKKA